MSEKAVLEPAQPVDRELNNEGGIQDEYYYNSPPSALPAYSGPSTPPVPTPAALPVFPGLPKVNYGLYSPPTFKLSADETTITSYKPDLSTSPAALNALIQQQATIPPKLQIRIKGGSGVGDIDFDLKLNLMTLLVGEGDPTERWNYLKVLEKGEMAFRGGFKEGTAPSVMGGIDEWVRRYCTDSSAIKQFTIQRIVTNWDTEYIEGRLHALIAATDYRKGVEITFPMTHSKVIVHSPDKVNRFFTSLEGLFTGTKKYEVVKMVWPYASVPPREGPRRFAVQSEEAWWDDWKDAIRHAVLTRRKGWVTIEDRLDFLMAPEKDKGKKWKQWDTGYDPSSA